jgi:hypothetical protein
LLSTLVSQTFKAPSGNRFLGSFMFEVKGSGPRDATALLYEWNAVGPTLATPPSSPLFSMSVTLPNTPDAFVPVTIELNPAKDLDPAK